MKPIEPDAVMTSIAAAAPGVSAGPNTGYETVRFNALKHGILSRYTVLAHEDADEFHTLLESLLDEHKPAGATEAHLVEELAGIMWRKRRVLQAEGASINQGLMKSARSPKSIVPAAAPFDFALSGEDADLRDVIHMTPDEIAERQRDAKHDLEATRRAEAILLRGAADAYDKAVRALKADSRGWWLEAVENEEYPATAEGLREFIREQVAPICVGIDAEARHHEAIKSQALGEGLQVYRLEKLTRYETHLDRKFERTLAMLLKLRELRGGRL